MQIYSSQQQLDAVTTITVSPETITTDERFRNCVENVVTYDGLHGNNDDSFTVVTTPLSCFGSQQKCSINGDRASEASKCQRTKSATSQSDKKTSTTTTKWYVKVIQMECCMNNSLSVLFLN